MNDPSSAREFRNVARDPLLQSGPAAGEDALIEIKSAVLAKLVLAVGKDAGSATDRDWFLAAALAIRDRIIHRWLASERASNAKGSKRVYYLSLEFLIGRLWSDVLCNLGLARRVPRRARRSGRGPQPVAVGRARRGARQRRPRTARGLLHGEHGEPGDPRLRLRYPL